LFHLVDKIENVKVDEEEIESLMPAIFRKLEWLEKEDILKRVISLEFNRMIDYYKDADEIQIVDERSNKREERGSRNNMNGRRNAGPEEGYTRFFINFGKSDGLFPNQLIELINKCVSGRVKVGRIDLRDTFSFFEIKENEAKRVMTKMNGFEIDGRRISVEYAQQRKEGNPGKERKGMRNKRPGYSDSFERNSDKPWRKRPANRSRDVRK
jgi:ATP-dependent RNA helicase DeaD